MVDEKTGEQGGPPKAKSLEELQKELTDVFREIVTGFRAGKLPAEFVEKEAEVLTKQSELLGKLARGEPIDEENPAT